MCMCVTFSFLWPKKKKNHLAKATWGRVGLLWLTVLGDTVHYGGEGIKTGTWDSWSHCRNSQEVGDEYWCLAHLILFIQTKALAPGMVLPTFKINVPASVNPI